MKQLVFTACLMALLSVEGFAQDQKYIDGIPADVYYLMPDFADGIVYFYSQAPAKGKLNICAVDQTLRFMDKDGKELQANEDQGISKVRIDTVWFLKSPEAFYRMYPVTSDSGIALRREVKIVSDAKEIAFGMTSQTGAIKTINKVYSDGVSVDITKEKRYPYEITELIYLYKGNAVAAFNKKSLKKVFPAKKAEIDEYFNTHKALPKTLEKALPLVAGWAKTE